MWSRRCQDPSQAGSRVWQCLPHGSGFRVMKDTKEKRLWSLTLWLKRATKAILVAGNPGIENHRGHCMKIQKWILYCFGDPRIWRCHNCRMSARRSCTQWNWPKEKKSVAVSEARRVPLSELFDIIHGVRGSGIFLPWFQSCFGQVFPHSAHIPPFWNHNVYSVLLYVGNM